MPALRLKCISPLPMSPNAPLQEPYLPRLIAQANYIRMAWVLLAIAGCVVTAGKATVCCAGQFIQILTIDLLNVRLHVMSERSKSAACMLQSVQCSLQVHEP